MSPTSPRPILGVVAGGRPRDRSRDQARGPARAAPGAWLSAGLWLACACAGLGCLLVYGNTPGPAGAAPALWPSPPGIELDAEHPTLLLFAHPRCPCTRASIRELERLVSQVGGRMRSRVLFFQPAAAEEGWERTDLWNLVEGIPGVRAAADPEGRIARTFGAETSGHVVVYDTSGRLVFAGGVTAARAHEGDNRGRDSIRHFANAGAILEPATPVFGCPIHVDAEAR